MSTKRRRYLAGLLPRVISMQNCCFSSEMRAQEVLSPYHLQPQDCPMMLMDLTELRELNGKRWLCPACWGVYRISFVTRYSPMGVHFLRVSLLEVLPGTNHEDS